MQVDTMRRIDRWVGVPLCAIASACMRLWWRISPSPPRPIRRVVLIELSEMGSAVLAEPAMRKIRTRLNAELFFVIFKRNAASLELMGTVPRENIFAIRDTSLWALAWDSLRFLAWARKCAIDTAVDLELFSRYSGLLTGLSGCSRRVGFYRFHNEGLYRGEMLTHRVAYNPHIHIAKNFIAQIDALLSASPAIPYSKSSVSDAEMHLAVRRPTHEDAGAMSGKIRALAPGFDPALQRLVLISPGGNEFIPQRRWPPERFSELIRRAVSTHEDVLVLITGAQNEIDYAHALATRAAHPRCASFAGQSAMADLPALYSLASVLVTSDSGPAHFAAACGLPTVVLFGPETPKLYRPLGPSHTIYAGLACSPCVSAQNHRRTPCTDNVCMQAITVDEVHAALEAELAKARVCGSKQGSEHALDAFAKIKN
jgi:ADP-heptose:LPS heptosyltransferase